MDLSLIFDNIKDRFIRENFFRVQKFVQAQAVLLANFTFYEVEISGANSKFALAHGLDFVPIDVIVLSIHGNHNVYFRYQEFDKTNIYLTAAGPVKVRFLAGRYSEPGYEKAPVNFPLVAPT